MLNYALLVKKFALCCLTILVLSGVVMQPVGAQGHGAVPLPPARPRVDQLGTMEGLDNPDRVRLVIMLSLQVLACVAVAIALAGHLSLPSKEKTQ
ncbi:MAG: hypothetical protein HY711_03820 [Candidatus Melainabacteria bacterium]|nr:hypothetical protein [Candidatus Melainabacteria bacterium]